MNLNFVAVGLFYIEYTNEVYYMSVEFTNSASRLPNDSLEDILLLVDQINTNGLPFDAKCVDVDVIINSKGKIIWEHSGDVVFNKYIEVVSLKNIMKNEKDEI